MHRPVKEGHAVSRRFFASCCLLVAVHALGCAAVASAGEPGDATWSVRPRSAGMQRQPKAVGYLEETDHVVTQSSVFDAPRYTQLDAASYHGNRLTQFRYFGPAGTGGIYDALEWERVERRLDPAKYRYHWGRGR